MWLFVASIILFLSLRLYPYLNSSVPLGYDAGLYLYLFKQYSKVPVFAYQSLDPWIKDGFPPGLALVGRLLSIFFSPETFLVPFIVCLSLVLLFAVYMVSKKLWGKRVALWTALILSCSALQYHEYWYYYAKQIAASSFLLFVIYFLIGSSLWAIPFAIAVVYTHQPTAIVLIGVLIAGFVLEKKNRRYYGLVTIITLCAAAIYYLPTFKATVQPLIVATAFSFVPKQLGGTLFTPSGSYYDWWTALLLSLPYLPFAVIGLLRSRKNMRLTPVAGGLAITLVIIVFGLFLSRRFIIFADLFVILFAGYGVTVVLGKLKKRIRIPAILLYIAFLIVFIAIYVYRTGVPAILNDELAEIARLRETEVNAYILVPDREYMPLVYGWSQRNPIAPQYGQYDIYWTVSEWNQFCSSGEPDVELNLLQKLPQPLYIYMGDRSPRYEFDITGSCFERINWRTYKFICPR